MLSFSDIVHRLESLLLIPTAAESPSSSARATADASSARPQHLVAFRAAAPSHEDDADLFRRLDRKRQPFNGRYEQDEISSSEDELDVRSAQRSVADRHGIGKAPLQAQTLPMAARQKRLHHSGRNLDLPTRIARAKTTWESLDFLRRAAAKLPGHAKDAQLLEGDTVSASFASGSSNEVPFLQMHEERLSAIEKTLKGDLRSLFSRLMTPGALLVDIDERAGLVSNPNSIGDLDRWSRTAPGLSQSEALSRKLEERKGWMLLLLEAWTRIDTDMEASIRHIQDHLSEKFVAPWCRDFVRLDHDGRISVSRTSGSPDAPHLQRDDSNLRLLGIDEKGDTSAFVPMFNTIIRFVHSMRGLTALLEFFDPNGQAHEKRSETFMLDERSDVSEQKRQARIQPFEAVIWSGISTALIEQVGERLFYVGAPDEFYRVSVSRIEHLATYAED